MKTISTVKKNKKNMNPEDIINNKWLKIHRNSHKISKSKDQEEIKKLRATNIRELKKINKLKELL